MENKWIEKIDKWEEINMPSEDGGMMHCLLDYRDDISQGRVLTKEQAKSIKNVIERIEYNHLKTDGNVVVENSYDGDMALILYRAFGSRPVSREPNKKK